MIPHRSKRSRAFSLIELVIVVVILGIIGAIAIPRMSRGAAGAADTALSSDLNLLRSAIDLYAAEHNGKKPDATNIVYQLTGYTDISGAGNTNWTKDATHIYGPYLREIPTLPIEPKGKGIVATADTSGGWLYDDTTGNIHANTPDASVDASGNKYNAY